MTSKWAVTVDLGGPMQATARGAGMLEWTRSRVLSEQGGRPALLFAQETFPAWLDLFDEQSGYEVVIREEPRWRVRSAIVYDRSTVRLEPIHDSTFPRLGYHDSYVAAARWQRDNGDDAILASVHASPSPAEPERYGWPDDAVRTTRTGGNDRRWGPPRLWDSDYLLLTLDQGHHNSRLPMIAAGDFNESLLDDPDEVGWGSQYFDIAAGLGISSWLHRMWSTPDGLPEQPTRGRLQLDHVLTAGNIDHILDDTQAPFVDQQWADVAAAGGLSDHAPIWFALT